MEAERRETGASGETDVTPRSAIFAKGDYVRLTPRGAAQFPQRARKLAEVVGFGHARGWIVVQFEDLKSKACMPARLFEEAC